MKTLLFVAVILSMTYWAIQPLSATELDADDSAVIFPALGKRVNTNTWDVQFHFWIFEKEKRPIALPLFRKMLGFDDDEMSPTETTFFQERASRFLADNERGKEIRIDFAGEQIVLRNTEANGHCRQNIFVEIKPLLLEKTVPVQAASKLSFLSLPTLLHTNHYQASCFLLEERGISVVSDIDDTIKQSDVLHRKALLRNTFLKPYSPIPGMAVVYQNWATNSSASFHYVTGSPWQLYEPLSDFVRSNHFPEGSFHMRDFRWKDETLVNLLSSPLPYKIATIEGLLNKYPKRSFVMVGDSGEKDPEIYGELARRHPQQINAVYIRNVSPNEDASERFNQAFKDCPRNLWTVFHDPNSLPKRLKIFEKASNPKKIDGSK